VTLVGKEISPSRALGGDAVIWTNRTERPLVIAVIDYERRMVGTISPDDFQCGVVEPTEWHSFDEVS